MEEGKKINIVSEAIAQLLMRHNCVIIPTLGGFIGNYEPSKILPHANKVIPPSKSILFNTKLINNDGLLIQHIADEAKLDYSTSEEIVQSFVATVQETLSEGKRFELNNVGFLFLQQNDQIGFEQDHAFNLYMNSFGLGSVRFVTFQTDEVTEHTSSKKEVVLPTTNKVVEEEPKVEETPSFTPEKQKKKEEKAPVEEGIIQLAATPHKDKKKVEKAASIHEEDKPLRKRSFKWSYAAAAMALPLVFYSLWIPMKSDVLKTKILQVEDFNPFHATPDESYSPRTAYYNHQLTTWEKDSINFSNVSQKAKYFNVPFIEGKMITVDLHRSNLVVSSETKTPVENNNVEPNSATQVNKDFHLIAGCFGDKSNANDMINQLKNYGFKAIIVDKNKGLYRVSAIQANSKDEVLQKRNRLETAGFKSWVLEK